MDSSHKLYVVGGYVRDKLLGIESKDIDFCFVIDKTILNQDQTQTITIEEGFEIMKQWLIQNHFNIFLETPQMLTIRAKFTAKTNIGFNFLFSQEKNLQTTADFVLARKEYYPDSNTRQPVVEVGSLYDDLERRDFTVNAMAIDSNGNQIDLFNGISDLNDKILKTPINPSITMLDDPLRVLRALRFSITKQFIISEDLHNAIIDNNVIDKLFNVVSKDRIREELQRMFKYSTPDTINILVNYDKQIPDFIKKIFDGNMWLKPTTEKIKNH